MTKFTVLNQKTTFKNNEKQATVVKVIKNGTKRTFFGVKNKDGKYIVTMLFAREYDANNVAKQYIKY
jgi:hypothetical protein